MPTRKAKPEPAKTPAEVDSKKLIAAVLARRKVLPFDPMKAGGAKVWGQAYRPAEAYGVGAHAKSPTSVVEAAESVVLPMVEYKGLKPTIMEGDALRVPWELFLLAFLDGYATAQELTGPTPKKLKLIGSKGAVTQFVKATAERGKVVTSGALSPIFESLWSAFLEHYGEGLRASTAASFAIGATLRCHETGASHPLLEELLGKGPPKARGLAIPKGKAAANEDLLAAILARPDDDAPRLVYADYLTTAGDARGEFIQLQCALGNQIRKAGKISTEPTRQVADAGAVKRAATLLTHSKGKWLEGTDLSDVTWARGFPHEGYCEASEFIENPAYDRVPLEGIKLIHWKAKLADAMFKRALHPTVRRFWFGSGFGPKVVQVLAAPVFSRAKELEAGFWEDGAVAPSALELLGKSTFSELESLEGTPELFAVMASAKCPRLHTFKLDGDGSVEPARRTRLWAQLRRLECFRLEDGERFAKDGGAEFSALSDATSLEVLSSVAVSLGEASVHALVKAAPRSLSKLEGGFGSLEPALVKVLSARFELVER